MQDKELRETINDIYVRESRPAFATLVRLVGDFDLAEEVLHEAFATAIRQWPVEGIPKNPRAWLISTGRFKAIDMIRRRKRMAELAPNVVERLKQVEQRNADLAEQTIADDTLRLIFTCCHPAIDPQVQIPLTLREVCGLTTEEIASAFMVPTSTMAQRIVRGKSKIRDARIPYAVPSVEELPERLDAVLAVIYLVFNEGYFASSGHVAVRNDLSTEAIRLGRLVLEFLPDSEVMGLLALMLLHESRRNTRTDEHGDIVLLENQDRHQWNQDYIQEGISLVNQAMNSDEIGSYVIQAAIAAEHAKAATADLTNWKQIVTLYDILNQAEPSPVVELNRAVAIAMSDSLEAGLRCIDNLLSRGELQKYHLAHSARGELLRRMGQFSEAKLAFETALSLTKQEPERRFLCKQLSKLD